MQSNPHQYKPSAQPKPKISSHLPLPHHLHMGTITRFTKTALDTSSASSPCTSARTPKRHKHHHLSSFHHRHQQQQNQNYHQYESLLPGLPEHIAQICLSLVQPSILYSVCRSWRRLIYSSSFPPFLSIYALLLSTQTTPEQSNLPNSVKFSCFDPISAKWHTLPPPLADPPLRLLLHHPSFISRRLPIQSVTVSGNLVLLAATADHFLPALTRPLVFNPLSQNWTYGPPLAAPRRWCAAGASRGVVYVASGIGSHYNPEVARSVEKWDLEINRGNHCSNNDNDNRRKRSCETNWQWERIEGLRDSKFSRDAIDAIGWKGKLCMVNVKGDAAKEGIIYNVKEDAWEDMPEGMLVGWRGPAASMDEETIYVVDESKGALRKYDPGKDTWEEILENTALKGAQFVAAAGGRVCVVGITGVRILVVDVMVAPPRLWLVDTPLGSQAVSIHILPRMSQPKF